MSPREKKLLTLFAVAGFVMANLIGLSLYRKKADELDARYLSADRVLKRMEAFEANRQERIGEMEWLEQHLPEPAENQNVQTALQATCLAAAQSVNLTIKAEELLASDQPGDKHFHRAKIRYRVTGMEKDLYRWFDRINMPNQLRGVTRIILSPNKEDDTRIDCTATIEQWFIPVGSSA